MSGPELLWHEVYWPAPLDSQAAIGLLQRLAADHNRGTVVWEVRGSEGRVRHLLGADAARAAVVRQIIATLVPGTTLKAGRVRRATFARAARLRIDRQQLPLAVERTPGATRAILAALVAAHRPDEEIVLQVGLGLGIAPTRVSPSAIDPTQSWFQQLSPRPASAEVGREMRQKQSELGFRVSIRAAARAATEPRRLDLLRGLLAALRTLQSPGTRLDFVRDSADAVDLGLTPGWRSLRLNTSEVLALLGWPVDAEDLPGLPSAHPRQLAPASPLTDRTRVFASTTAPGAVGRIGIGIADALVHTVITGPTNSGKSTVLLNLITADLKAGRGVVVIDPKGDLVSDVLARIPKTRTADVVVLDPTQDRPAGFNPLARVGTSPELVADGILAVIRDLFPTMFGPRTADVLHASLLTLARREGATLTWLPRLLTDPAFRAALTAGIDDPDGLESFWWSFNAMSAAQQAQFVGPVLSRLRQFLLRPGLRRVLDQTAPQFDLADVFRKRRVLLVPLNTGLLGGDAARLLGSLLVGQLWQLTLARAALPAQRRHPVSIYIDETQEFVRLGHDLGDALARSRSLGVAWHLAHQFRDQLPVETRAAVDANALNKIVFTLGAKDARDLAAMAPELAAEDFMALGRFEIYAHLIQDGRRVGWISGRTTPAPPITSDAVEIVAESQRRYGRRDSEKSSDTTISSEQPDGAIGRRKRTRP